jgi:hypothetical protein
VGSLSETSIVSSKETCKMHKRFKLDNVENLNQEDSSHSIHSEEENLEVTREVFRCDSPALTFKEQKDTKLPSMLHLFKKNLL